MDDAQIGSAVRAVRIRSKLTQADVAQKAHVRRYEVSCLEQGKFADMPVGMVRRIVGAVGMWLEIKPNWQGINLDRLLHGSHTALQEAVLALFERLPAWEARAEVSFAHFGERGVIDVFAWHAATRTVLIIELKTLLVDPADLAKTMGQRSRLGVEIAATQGWRAKDVATWVIFTDTRTNRREVAQHRKLLRRLAKIDGHAMRTWLRSPTGPTAALSFWDEPNAVIRRHVRTRFRRSKEGVGGVEGTEPGSGEPRPPEPLQDGVAAIDSVASLADAGFVAVARLPEG